MHLKSLSRLWGDRKKQHGKHHDCSRSRRMRFEPLEPRQMLAVDFGWQAAGSSISDDAEAVPAIVAQQADAVETPATLKNSSVDSAARLHEKGSELPPSDVIDTLRALKDIDAIQDGNGAAALPEPGDEDVDPRTTAFDLLGDGSSKPGIPGGSQGDDRGQMLDAMMETFRGGACEGDPWSSPGDSSAPQSQDPQRDPFARVGWAKDDDGEYTVSSGSPDGTGTIRVERSQESWSVSVHTTEGGTTVITGSGSAEIDGRLTGGRFTMIVGPSGTVVTGTTMGDDGKIVHEVVIIDADGDHLETSATEPEVNSQQAPGDGSQPNPADDSRGLTFINPDPWALFLAWYTGQTGSPLKDPYDDDPGGDPHEAGYGSPSAAPRVGLEAVINPGDSNFVTRPSGGGRDPSDGPIGPPER